MTTCHALRFGRVRYIHVRTAEYAETTNRVIPMQLILHRSLKSPYAQKAMLLMGYLDQSYLSVVAPKGVPRPIQEKLVGNYARRIPILQIGADMYCDTELIMRVLARRTGSTSLLSYPSQSDAEAWVAKIEAQGALALMGALSPWELIKAYFRNMSPRDAWQFITDRAKLRKHLPADQRQMTAAEKRANARAWLEELNQHLQGRRFLLTDSEPSSVDFTAFTMIYYHNMINRLSLADGLNNLHRWFASMEAFGTGAFSEISGQQALDIARENEPAPVSEHLLASDRIGQAISYTNKGFMTEINEAVNGVVVGEDERTLVLGREDHDVGSVHVHFPKLWY